MQRGIKSIIVRYFLYKIRIWDVAMAGSVDVFIANSRFIARRIQKFYRRDSVVIYPPVKTEDFQLNTNKEDFYLTISRLVPYKRVRMIAEAFRKMPDKRLVIVGDGPELRRIQDENRGFKNIEILGYQTQERVQDLMQRAKAFVFAGKEDFGITMLEAQACGTPVIAYRAGGAIETVRGLESNSPIILLMLSTVLNKISNGLIQSPAAIMP
jgi:glycosyltransferase involved in cell wall biosynthesis